jgi:DNA-binding PadR family transcriptional regulator
VIALWNRSACRFDRRKLREVWKRLTKTDVAGKRHYAFRKRRSMTSFDKSSQRLLVGFIRLHVLHHAVKEDICGHWMMEELRHHGYVISPGTLYPMLRAMEKDGWIVGRNDPHGGSRKLFRATRAGRRALEQAKEKLWELFSEVLRPNSKEARKG